MQPEALWCLPVCWNNNFAGLQKHSINYLNNTITQQPPFLGYVQGWELYKEINTIKNNFHNLCLSCFMGGTNLSCEKHWENLATAVPCAAQQLQQIRPCSILKVVQQRCCSAQALLRGSFSWILSQAASSLKVLFQHNTGGGSRGQAMWNRPNLSSTDRWSKEINVTSGGWLGWEEGIKLWSGICLFSLCLLW